MEREKDEHEGREQKQTDRRTGGECSPEDMRTTGEVLGLDEAADPPPLPRQ